MRAMSSTADDVTPDGPIVVNNAMDPGIFLILFPISPGLTSPSSLSLLSPTVSESTHHHVG